METENNGDVLWGPPRPGEMGGALPQPRELFPVTISLVGVGGQRVILAGDSDSALEYVSLQIHHIHRKAVLLKTRHEFASATCESQFGAQSLPESPGPVLSSQSFPETPGPALSSHSPPETPGPRLSSRSLPETPGPGLSSWSFPGTSGVSLASASTAPGQHWALTSSVSQGPQAQLLTAPVPSAGGRHRITGAGLDVRISGLDESIGRAGRGNVPWSPLRDLSGYRPHLNNSCDRRPSLDLPGNPAPGGGDDLLCSTEQETEATSSSQAGAWKSMLAWGQI